LICGRRRSGSRTTLAILLSVFLHGCTAEIDPGPPSDTVPAEAGRLSLDAEPRISNGWFVQDGRAIWGYAQHNGWWGGYREGNGFWTTAGVRANITRRAPGRVGPGWTEDLDLLTDAMIAFGYPGFEHNFGLWYDRRRDAHDSHAREDAAVVPPFLEQPWARSDQGTAWDGLPRYDLEKFNPWYFERLREFADHCDRKGCLLLFNFYMQHALLEQQAHYADFPWRPVNAIQETGMPDRFPAANVFYDTRHAGRRRLHRLYIRKCLDELGEFRNVVFLPSMEYTGPLEFVRFWLDTVHEWEVERGRRVLTGVGATKDVLDALLVDPVRGPRIAVIDLRYWFWEADGTLRAPRGGEEVPGRYAGGPASARAPAELIYRQVAGYRGSFPERAILHAIGADRRQTWAFLMAGGSLLVRPLGYPAVSESEPWVPPERYIEPGTTPMIRPLYELLRGPLASTLPSMRPLPARVDAGSTTVWAIGNDEDHLLIYALDGGSFRVSAGAVGRTRWTAVWLDPRSGELGEERLLEADPDRPLLIETPDEDDWALWLRPA
jgi:hypothetical protein